MNNAWQIVGVHYIQRKTVNKDHGSLGLLEKGTTSIEREKERETNINV